MIKRKIISALLIHLNNGYRANGQNNIFFNPTTTVNDVEVLDIALLRPSPSNMDFISKSVAPTMKTKSSKTSKQEKINNLKPKCSKGSKKGKKGSKKEGVMSRTIDIFNFDCLGDIETNSTSFPSTSSSSSSSFSLTPTLIQNEPTVSLSSEYKEDTIKNDNSNAIPPYVNNQITNSDRVDARASVSTLRALRTSLIVVCAMFIVLLLYEAKTRRGKNLTYVSTDDKESDDKDDFTLEDDNDIQALNANTVEAPSRVDEEAKTARERSGVQYVYTSHNTSPGGIATILRGNNKTEQLTNREVSDLTQGTENSTLGIKPKPILKKGSYRGLKNADKNDAYYYNFNR